MADTEVGDTAAMTKTHETPLQTRHFGPVRRPQARYAPPRPRVGAAVSAVVITLAVAIVVIVLPASPPADARTVTLATLTHAARAVLRLL